MDPISTAAIQISRSDRRAAYSVEDLGVVASVRYQGGWIVRHEWSPEESDSQRVATREYAEALALRHALALA